MSQYRAIDKPLERLDRHRRLLFFFHRFTAQFRTVLEDSLYPWTLDGARQNRIGTNAEFAQFDGECVGETEQCPLGCRVSAPVGIRIADNDP